MLTINAKLEGHQLTITGTPQLAADSAYVDRVKFDFDSEWTGFSRVALFWGSDGEDPYAVAVDGQGYAVIPWETIQEKGRMRFGVYGIKGTSRITSTVLKYQIQDGAWSASPANPGEITPTMLEQLQALVETAVEQMDDRLAEFDAAVETFFPHRGGVGALVTVEGTVDASPAGLTIYGRSVQNGTPAPDAPADIVTAGSGGTLSMVSAGKNLFYPTYRDAPLVTNGITFTYDPTDGAVVASGTATGIANYYFSRDLNSRVNYLPNGRYKFRGGISESIYLTLWEGTDSSGSRYDTRSGETANITVTHGAIYNPRIVILEGTVCNNVRIYPMLWLAMRLYWIPSIDPDAITS